MGYIFYWHLFFKMKFLKYCQSKYVWRTYKSNHDDLGEELHSTAHYQNTHTHTLAPLTLRSKAKSKRSSIHEFTKYKKKTKHALKLKRNEFG